MIELCSQQNGTEGQAKSGPILSLPLMTIADPGHPLRDMPVCQVKYTVSEHLRHESFISSQNLIRIVVSGEIQNVMLVFLIVTPGIQ